MYTYDSEYGCNSSMFDLIDFDWELTAEPDTVLPVPFPELDGLDEQDTEVVYEEVF
jgi:hypothetical protein